MLAHKSNEDLSGYLRGAHVDGSIVCAQYVFQVRLRVAIVSANADSFAARQHGALPSGVSLERLPAPVCRFQGRRKVCGDGTTPRHSTAYRAGGLLLSTSS